MGNTPPTSDVPLEQIHGRQDKKIQPSNKKPNQSQEPTAYSQKIRKQKPETIHTWTR
jgi:hypothetical protein